MSMPARLTRTGAATGIVLALALATGTGYAANGGGLVLGKKNKATKSTVIQNKKTVPLKLKAKKRKPALKVNTKAKIKKLNADFLDGVSSEAFLRASSTASNSSRLGGKGAAAYALTSGRTGVVRAFGSDDDVPGNAFAAATARCPAGTVLTGGGGQALTTGDYLWYSGPGEMPNSWEADSDGDGEADTGDEVIAWAVCYNPRGAVPGAISFGALRAEMRALRGR
jgi:hypothetical protein